MTRFGRTTAAFVFGVAAALSTIPASAGGETALKLRMQMTATPGQTLTLDLQRWSTDEERASFMSALSAAPAAESPGRGPGGRGGTGAPARGRGPAPAPAAGGGSGVGNPDTADAPSDSSVAPAAPAVAAGRGAGGRSGAAGARGGRGRGATPNASPEARLAAAVKAAPTLGFVWGGVTGYSVKYAWRSSGNGRPDRLVLLTDRRLDIPAASTAHAASAPAAGSSGDSAADFTVLEIRFDPTGTGEGKTSITTSAVVDQTAGTVAVQNYDAIPPQIRITP
jgi:hypothetical protein